MSRRRRIRDRTTGAAAVPGEQRPVWPDYLMAGGLALVVIVRPWRDGATFQGFNAYFVWLIMALAAFWAARVVFKESAFRFGAQAAALAAFLGVAAVTAYDTVLPDHTYRQLVYWSSYLFLFVLAANQLRTSGARGLFFTAFAITMTLSAAWALIHLHYVLPQVRELLEQNPEARRYYFQTRDLPPELAHRLSVNRAYGATLFPNALAAFMILALPFLIAEFLAAALDWKRVRKVDAQTGIGWLPAIAAGGATALVLGGASRVLYPVVHFSITSDPGWREGPLVLLVLYGAPVALGAAAALLLRVSGWKRSRLYLQLVLLPPAVFVVALALYRTYSRGGMLAFAIAAIVVAALAAYRSKRLPAVVKAAGFVLLGALPILGAAAHAQELPAEGVGTDVFSAQSFLARLDYWRVGLSMILDNPLSGVGLGAFGPAYARYMFPGASVSQMAHNHFIQIFAETGIFGVVAILVFWLLTLRFLFRALLSASDTPQVLRIAGPLAGVLAFLIHACVDFNFANPSLAMTAFVLTGAACARAATVRAPEPVSDRKARYGAIAVLTVAAMGTAAMIRIYAVDYALTGPLPAARKLIVAGNRLEIRDKLYTAQFYMDRLASHPENPQRVLYSDYERLLGIVPDPERILEFGFLATLDTSNGNRFTTLPNSGPLPPHAVVVITDVDKARQALIDSAEALLADMETIDAPYPYNVEASMHAYEWCDLVFTYASDSEVKRRFAREGERWARRTVERSPYQNAAWLAYGKALWQRASVETDRRTAQELYDKGLDAYRRSAEVFPASPDAWEHYASALVKLGEGYVQGGQPDKGRPLLAEAETVRQRIADLQQQWAASR